MKNVIKSKRFYFILIISLIIVCFIRVNYVFIEGNIYNHNTEIISVQTNKINFNELNRCSKLKELYLADADNNFFNEIKAFDSLETLIIMESKCKISGRSIEKINQLSALKFLGIDLSDADLKGLNNDYLETLTLTRSNISSLSDISSCKNLTELRLSYVTAENNIDFSTLDNIKSLKIYDTKIEDISGILDMESLEELTVSKDMLSEENSRLLEEKGISVTVSDEK